MWFGGRSTILGSFGFALSLFTFACDGGEPIGASVKVEGEAKLETQPPSFGSGTPILEKVCSLMPTTITTKHHGNGAPSGSNDEGTTDQDSTLYCSGSTFGGRARIVSATVGELVGVSVVDSGNLPAAGGAVNSDLLAVTVNGLLRGKVASATVTGSAKQTRAKAEVTDLDLGVLGIGISADVVRSISSSTCNAANPTRGGDSEITNLRINGLKVSVDSTPNQTIDVLGLIRVTINEQKQTANGFVVNAIHVTGLSGTALGIDVVVSSALSDITCSCEVDAPEPPTSSSSSSGSTPPVDPPGEEEPTPPTSSSSSGGSSSGGSSSGGSSSGGSSSGGNNGGGHGGLGDNCDDARPCGLGLFCTTKH